MTGINDHQPIPVGTTIMMTGDQIADIKAYLSDLHATQNQPAPAVLSDDQFAELKRLLEPGYQLSKLYLADRGSPRSMTEPPIWDGRGDLPNNSPLKEWRTRDQIAAGVLYQDSRSPEVDARERAPFDPRPPIDR